MIPCIICGKNYASEFLQVCVECIRNHDENTTHLVQSAYEKSRKQLNLPLYPPKTKTGIYCNLCMNECKIGEGEWGFCGIRQNCEGKLLGPTKNQAFLHEYYDKNPTNCCAAWYCPSQTEIGTYNHSIFFYGCNFNCLYCQNSSHKSQRHLVGYSTIEHVLTRSNRKDVRCVCYFGGSPEPHFPFALNLSKKLMERPRIKRICWEWNGGGNQELVKKAANYSLQSGGIVKFDLKAIDPHIAKALLGVSIERTYDNFRNVSKLFELRPENPVVTATTLLVPYYIDDEEVESIVQFIADLNPAIPYSMLVFHPQFFLSDLPITPVRQVKQCYTIAKKYLKNVNVGNLHLIGNISLD